ncbi:lysophospholipid acyltransferase family protein [Streptomyces sp.]|uniref:lysophospholipid acyltransferase family protein n=1 Tax=Streptomyces sp. TaxID=1931 RepID=UPI002F406472
MADAKVIPFDEDSRTRRGGGRSRPRSRKAAAPAGNAAVKASGNATGGAGQAEDATAEQGPLTAVPEVAEIPAQAVPEGLAAEGRGAEARVSEAAVSEGPEAAEAPGAGVPESPAAAEGPGPDPGPEEPGEEPAEPEALSLTDALSGLADKLLGGGWERKAASGLAFLRRRITGEYEVDEFGYDEDLTEQVLMPLFRPLFEKYFRVEVKGVENIPAEGGALVVCNHSGTLPWDGVMAQIAVRDHHPADRHLRLLAADLVFALPGVNELARKGGHTLACTEDAQLLLERGEVVGVMPEGFKGLGKPFAERYKLQRFGRGGFVATALKTGKPIVPCSIVGAEEIYPMLGNSRTMARLLGLPYFPLTPTFPWLGPLGTIPLPTKWTIQFGTPIPTDGYPPESAEDPMLVFNLTDQVRETIQHTLYELLVQRRSVFF